MNGVTGIKELEETTERREFENLLLHGGWGGGCSRLKNSKR